MSAVYDLEHITTYRYANPVEFGKHRAIFFYPRRGPTGAFLSHSIGANIPVEVRWMMDTLSNNVALLQFEQPASELAVTFRLRGEHFGYGAIGRVPPRHSGREIPIQYTSDEWMDMMMYLRPPR